MLVGRVPLFKTLFGSKLYGTNTPQSDEDWKEVFLPDPDLLLMGKKLSNIVHSTGQPNARNTKDDVDYEWIPIHVFAKDALGGKTYAIEVAFAVLGRGNHARQELTAPWFYEFTHELVSKFLTSNVKSMVGYAKSQVQVYRIKGSRLATARKFAEYLDASIANRTYKLTDRLHLMLPWVKENSDKYLFHSTYEEHGDVFDAISLLEKQYRCNITFEEAVTRTKALMDKYGSRAFSAELACVDWKATAHSVRIVQEAIELLKTHKLEFPFKQEQVRHLLDIKHGNVPLDDVAEELAQLFDELDMAKESTTLPPPSLELDVEFEKWLKNWMHRIYFSKSLA